MNFEPQKFFINLVGFFSVILPGALLAYLGMDWIAETFVARAVYGREGWEEWLVFFFVAYLLGHIVFLLGSTLDELVYAPLRGATAAGQVRLLSRGSRLTDARLRSVAGSRWVFGRSPDAAVLQAERSMAADLSEIGAAGAINAYQWSKVRLSRDHPPGLLAVERFEADSKFFRSFSVVLVILILVFLWQLRVVAAISCAVLLVPALWRYVDQRFKGTQQAYWHVLALKREEQLGSPAATGSQRARPDGLTHAGGVVYRESAAGTEYLLVETSGGGEWVLPKGHIEPFEPPEETAVREVLEEAGIWARLIAAVADVDLRVNGRPIAVRFYLMEALESEKGKAGVLPEGRRQQWVHFGEAIATASHEETRQALAAGDRLRNARRSG